MDFVKGITQFRKIASTARKGYIVYAGELTPDLPHAKVLRFKRLISIIEVKDPPPRLAPKRQQADCENNDRSSWPGTLGCG